VLCRSTRSTSAETGGLVSAAEVGQIAGNCGESSDIAVADAVEREELSASAEPSVRLPGAKPPRCVQALYLSAPGGTFEYTPGKKIQERGPFPCPNVAGVRLLSLRKHSRGIME